YQGSESDHFQSDLRRHRKGASGKHSISSRNSPDTQGGKQDRRYIGPSRGRKSETGWRRGEHDRRSHRLSASLQQFPGEQINRGNGQRVQPTSNNERDAFTSTGCEKREA